jgi:demethylmenaquinone methyltransferase/2-methoxy-6-polyprenyl-1,4-benzoquinol methylase
MQRHGAEQNGAPTLRAALASPDTKGRYVRRLFSTIADRYDLITVLLSYGRDRRWKERVVSLAEVTGSVRALDLACGTGDIAFGLAARGASVTGLDVTHRMLQLARAKARPSGPRVRFVAGDMMTLPFGSHRFEIVTTGYGIRNVPLIAPAIAEIHRVLRPGGVFLSLDFNRPSNAAVRAVYLTYLTLVGSALGFALHRDRDTYRYIPESIRRHPGAERITQMIRSQGFATCEYIPVLGGLMAIHHARK